MVKEKWEKEEWLRNSLVQAYSVSRVEYGYLHIKKD